MDERILEKIENIESKLEEVHKEIVGDHASLGLKTRVYVNKNSIKRIWGFIGGIVTAIIGFAFFIIRKSL